jgi:cytochrome c553
LIGGLILGLVLVGPVLADAPAGAGKCETCHGVGGNSASGEIPRLNGQSWRYLAERVRSFRDPTRQSPHATYFMWTVNSSLTDAQVLELTRYFSSQAPTTAAPAGALAEQGRKLYQNGDGKALLPCHTCHGASAEGGGNAPRLNGQHAVYLRRQLEDFSMLTRVHETMNSRGRNLTGEQIAALVAYLAKD